MPDRFAHYEPARQLDRDEDGIPMEPEDSDLLRRAKYLAGEWWETEWEKLKDSQREQAIMTAAEPAEEDCQCTRHGDMEDARGCPVHGR